MRKFLSVTLVLTPFIILLATGSDLVGSLGYKVILYRLVATFGLVGIFWLSFTAKREEILARAKRLLSYPLFWAISINMALLAMSTALAHDPYVAFFGEPTRGEGFLTIFALSLIGTLMMMLFDRADWNRLMEALTLTGVALFIYELVQLSRGVGRPYSLAGNPIFLASIFCFVLWSGWYFVTRAARSRVSMRYGIAIMVMSIVGILLTKTRGTILGLGVATLVTALLVLGAGKTKTILRISARTVAGVVLGATILFGAIFFATRHAALWQHVPGLNRVAETTSHDSTVDSRLLFAKITWNGFTRDTSIRQLFGWGWDNYGFFWNQNYLPTVFYSDPSMADRAHDKLLDELAMTGVLGLLSYLGIWVFFFREGARLMRREFAFGVGTIFLGVAYFVHNLTAFDSIETFMLFYTLLAATTFYAREI